MTLPMASSRSSVGLGHPSSSSLLPSPGPIGLKSPSASLSRSTSALLTPIDLAQAHYQSAAHHFLQRSPVLALVELEQTRRLVIDHQSEGASAWSSVCEKATILWITLLISLRKLKATSKDQVELNDGYSETTRELLSHNDSSRFLSSLLSAVCQIYAKGQRFDDAPTAGSSSSSRGSAGTTILPPPETDAGQKQRAVLAVLPEKVTASVIMALLGVEEGPRSSGGDAASVPLTRSLAEELLNSQVKALDDSQSDATAVMASYSRTLELYAIHVLGVRCGEWAYADQIVRTSLLHDEARATLLASLSRAQQHIDTRPQRRASALQAQQARYEEEKSKRAKADKQRAASGADQRDADESNALKTKNSGQVVSTNNGNLTQNRDKSPKPRSLPQATSSTSSAASSPRPSPPLPSFDVNRSQSSRSISRDRERSEKEDGSADSSSSSSSLAKRQTLLAKSGSFWSSSGIAATLRSLKISNLQPSSLISILAPLVILVFTLRRLRVGKSRIAAAGVPVASASAAASSGSSSVNKNANRSGGVRRGGDNLFVVAVGKVWNTVKMGTQVSYL